MSELSAYLQLIDDAWSHSFDSVCSALDGLTDAEAAYQDAAYRDEPPLDGWPPPGSVAWQMAHLAHYKAEYAATIREAVGGRLPGAASPVETASRPGPLAALRGAHAEQRAAVAALQAEGLSATAPSGETVREVLASAIRHDLWHAGQIAVARRLYRTRISDDGSSA